MANLRMFTSMSDSGMNSGFNKIINNLKKVEQISSKATSSVKKFASTKIKPFNLSLKDTISKSINNIKSKLKTLSGKTVEVSIRAKDYATKIADNINKKMKKMFKSAKTLALNAKDNISGKLNTIKLKFDHLKTSAKNVFSNMSKQMNKIDFSGVGAKVDNLTKKIGSGLVNAAKTATTAIISIGTAASTAVASAVKSFGKYEQTLGGTKTLFGVDDMSLSEYAKSKGKSIADVEKDYKNRIEAEKLVMKNAREAYKYAGTSAEEYMNTVNSTSASMIQSLKGDALKAAEVSDTMLKDISDNVNKLGSDIGFVSYAYTGFARGQFLMLDNLKLGYQGTKSEMERLLSDAQKISGVKYDINSYADIVQAIHVIQENMGITGTTVREAEQTIEGSTRMMKSSWKDLMTAFVLGGDDLDRCIVNLIDSTKAFAKNVSTAVDKALTNLLKRLGPVGKSIQRVIDKFKAISKDSKKMAKITEVFKSLKKVVEKVVDITADLVEKFLDFITAEKSLNNIKKALDLINDALVWCEDNWDTVKTAILGVISVIGGLKLSKFIWDLNDALVKVGLLEKGLSGMQKLTLAVGVTLAITGIVLETKGIIDTVKEGLDFGNFGEIVGGGGTLVAGAALIGKTFGSALLGGALGGIVAGIPAFAIGIWDAIKNGIDWLSGALIGAGATATGAGIGAIIGMLGGPIGAGVGALIGLAVGLVTDLVILIVQKWDEICAWFSQVFSAIGKWFSDLWSDICAFFAPVGEWFANVWNTIKESAITAWNSICGFFSTIGTWIYENVIAPVVNFFTNAFYFIVGIAAYVWEGICLVWGAISGWVYENVISPVINFFTWLWTKICEIVSSVWTWICETWGAISGWVSENVITPVVGFFTWLWQSICNIVTNVWTWICETWGKVSGWVSENVITPVVGFFTGLWDSITTIVSNVWNSICEIWGKISGWVNENIINPIKTFFQGLWDDITGKVDDVKTSITGAFTEAWNEVTELWEGITDFFSGLWDGIKDWVNKVIGKGKEAMGVSDDVKKKDKKGPREHAWGGLVTRPHLGLVGEAGPEMIIPLSNNKRSRGADLWKQAGRIMGIIPHAEGGLVGSVSKSASNPNNSSASATYTGNIIINDNLAELWDNINKQFVNGISNVKDITDNFANDMLSKFSNFQKELVSEISKLPNEMGNGLRSSGGSLKNSLVSIWKDAVVASSSPVNKVIGGANWVLKELGSDKKIASWTPYAKGTDGHRGGNALVNDGRGAELVQLPNGKTFIPDGRNVFMPNAPKGMKVLSAENTAKVMGRKSPTFKYAEGTGFDFDIWNFIDNAKGLVEKLTEKVSYEGLSGLSLGIGEGLVGTAKGAMSAWVKKLFDEMGVLGLAGYNPSRGVEQWRSTVIRALKMEGQYNALNLAKTLYQMQTESGGNPKAINLWDSNAKKGIPSKGLMQVIDPTFNAYARKGFNKNIWDPLSNILASIRYAVSRYGSLEKAYKGKGYANGGIATTPSIFAEAGAEMAIPLSNSKRNRGINLWRQAGNILGAYDYENTREGESISDSKLRAMLGINDIERKGSHNDNRTFDFKGMIGEIHVHNEADEDRFIAKLKKVLEDEVFGGGDTVYD